MGASKQYSRKLFSVTMIVVMVYAAIAGFLFYLGLDWVAGNLEPDRVAVPPDGFTGRMYESLDWMKDNYFLYVLPSLVCLFAAGGAVLWAVLTIPVSQMVDRDLQAETGGPEKSGSSKDGIEQRLEQERKQRVFLHNISVLQREGRLLDFFQEDLSLYEDEQIGAAVRSIHEDCSKAMKKYIDPRPLHDLEEGAQVTIEPGFDMEKIRLVGNVAGDPPFTGIVKHRGWRAGKKGVPRLFDVRDASVIAPAEIEIQ